MGRVEKGLELLQTKKYESALKKFKEAKHLDATFANAPKQIAITMRLINTAQKKQVYSQQDIDKELLAHRNLSSGSQSSRFAYVG